MNRHSFFGRDDEVARLGALETPGVLCVTGPGGAGKTRLVRHAFDDDDLFVVEFGAAVTRADAAAVLANTLRTAVSDASDGDAFALALQSRDASTVLFDNLEQLDDEAIAFLGDIATSRPLAVVATSRRRLPAPFDGRVDLNPLSVDDAVALLLDRARLSGVPLDDTEANPDRIAQICEQLERFPLVVELAAGALRFATVDQLAQQIDAELDAAQKRGGPRRQRTLRESLAWSVELLSDDGREALGLAAAFRGGFHVGLFERASGWEPRRVRAGLADLLDANLARYIDSEKHRRMSVYESVRAYVSDVTPQQFERAQMQQAGAMLQRATETATAIRTNDEAQAMDWVVRERDNLRAAWGVLHAADDVRLCTLAVALAEPLRRLGPNDVVERALESASELAKRHGEQDALARIEIRRAHLLSALGDDDRTWARIDHIDEDAPPDVQAEVHLLKALMPSRGVTIDAAQRLQWLEAAERHARDAADEWLETIAHGMSATALLGLGREDDAFDRVRDALDRAETLASPSLRLRLRMQLARMSVHAGDTAAARMLVEGVEADAAEAHETIFELESLLAQGSLLLGEDDIEASNAIYARTLRRANELAHELSAVGAAMGLGTGHLMRQEFSDAERIVVHARSSNRSEFFGAYLLGIELAAGGALGHVSPEDARFETVRETFEALQRRNAAELRDAFRLYAQAAAVEDPATLRSLQRRAVELSELGDRELSQMALGAMRFIDSRLPSGPLLRVGPDLGWLEADGEERSDISSRHILKRLLGRLLEHHASGAAEGLDVYDLVEAGWPDEVIQPEAAASRLYTSVRYLRNMGLRDILIRDEVGYLLEPTTVVRRPDE